MEQNDDVRHIFDNNELHSLDCESGHVMNPVFQSVAPTTS